MNSIVSAAEGLRLASPVGQFNGHDPLVALRAGGEPSPGKVDAFLDPGQSVAQRQLGLSFVLG